MTKNRQKKHTFEGLSPQKRMLLLQLVLMKTLIGGAPTVCSPDFPSCIVVASVQMQIQ